MQMERIEVSGENAIEELERLQHEFSTSGEWPILLGDEEELDRIEEGLADTSETPIEILDASNDVDAESWFADRVLEDPDLYECEDGDWPEEEPEETGIVTHLNLSLGKPKKKVFVALIPVEQSYEAFAHLNWGGWNDCPIPQDQCAIHRYWKEKYGSEVVSITGDVVQCVVANPPRDQEEALALAREQYLYCYDIVEQGTGTIAALAASLINAKTWYFWWD